MFLILLTDICFRDIPKYLLFSFNLILTTSTKEELGTLNIIFYKSINIPCFDGATSVTVINTIKNFYKLDFSFNYKNQTFLGVRQVALDVYNHNQVVHIH